MVYQCELHLTTVHHLPVLRSQENQGTLFFSWAGQVDSSRKLSLQMHVPKRDFFKSAQLHLSQQSMEFYYTTGVVPRMVDEKSSGTIPWNCQCMTYDRNTYILSQQLVYFQLDACSIRPLQYDAKMSLHYINNFS